MSYIVHSSISEHGTNGWDGKAKAGDQTGKEVCTRKWYSKPWDCVLRYPDITVSAQARDIAIKLANSNLVGYDQSQRNTLYKQLKKNNWDIDKYIKSGIKTECDCSSFVYAVYCCVLPKLRGESNAPTTATIKSFMVSKGFKCYKTSDYTARTNKLVKGDLLNKAGSHIVMFAGNDVEVDTVSEVHKIEYYNKYLGKSGSIVEVLNNIGVDSSYSNRKNIAIKNGIKNYSGTAAQNTKLLSLLKLGKLIK